MKAFLRKFLLLYIGATLCVAPMALHAASKKTHKQVTSASKYKAVKYKAGSRKVNHRIRAHKANLVDNYDGSTPLKLASAKALVINQVTGEVLYAKNTNVATPIASVTKLMTAMVMLDARLAMDELVNISDEDVDYLKSTSSRLRVGTVLTRAELLQLALMASENRAASALGRAYPGGKPAFIQAMNQKAKSLGMFSTRFVDSTGLDSANVSTAEDLVKMVNAAYHYPEIREVSTLPSQEITLYGRQNPLSFVNTNALVRGGNWVIGLSKTGFINEAGRCLVMQAEISGQPVIMVLLDSAGKMTRIGDANRIRKWVEKNDTNSLGENVHG
ncbi:MAG: D-alanyl-D-alanine endopeptidase [Methylotenera sp. 24-45-7]|jgi:D-alanyl-D-alanine endopeptidase (penicillin-binding protein 7)|nr:MAG: D-alanyl-D-alanine endopeptidase [Mehylophilales bacterium 35-46-6]OYZ40711.1 MAG: D-alanyl-D-alanine endopeptidase [Methylotenera sp. 24-45-7]OZA09814.1 MAG: D-alanyl-D-alanine endopeptidase [Methylotenera sp. 17-45-7]HQS43806.1 D-alanyl-D-alanine endopeptidase [Methylotenera sp.]